MISIDTYNEIKNRSGDFASWAVWAKAGDKPTSNIGDLDVLDPDKNSCLLNTLHGNFIFLGLNISRRIEQPLGNFHDSRPSGKDYKIRFALEGTPFWGSYMTDIIKDFEEKASGKMMAYLRSNRDFERENISMLREEIEVLGFRDPTLVAFGNDAEEIARRNMSKEFKIVRVPHYANYNSKENYRDIFKICF